MPIPVRRGWGSEDLLVVPKGFKLATGRQEKLQLRLSDAARRGHDGLETTQVGSRCCAVSTASRLTNGPRTSKGLG